MNPFLISTKCPMLFGCGTSMTVASKIQELGCKKVMIVCDDWLSKQENFKAFMNTFSEVETYVWNHVIPDPTDISVEEGAVIARQENIDGIIGIGGGSSLDSAKAINTLLHSDFPINQYFAELGPDAKVPNPGVPMILIPTTSGTGADCSPAAVITNTRLNNVKNNLFVPNGIPDLAVVDPDWAMTMPPKLTASCGFDVFSHAVETISSSRWNPMSETIALKCIDIVWTYLERAYHNGSDVEAREYMHFASSAVAVAFSDSLINFSKQIPLYKEHVIAYVSAKAAAYDSLRMYKEAYETSKEYAVLLDTLRMQELRKKMENLEIEKGANKLVIEKKSLELELQKSKKENYLYISLLLLALCAVFYIFFRLGKMRSLYQALQKSNEQVLIANQKAQESEEMKTAFIRNMSHEIRTPLNAINGFSELITNDDISMDEKQAFSRIIYENCYHLTSMLNNLLEIAQLDSGNDSLPLVPTRIHELCLYEMQQVKKYQEKPEINYVVEGDKENDMILTNRAYFSLIISHLLANANKFTEKGSITLSYHLDSGANLVTLSVTDTGCGIPQDKQEWIFERFTKTNDFIPGSGLGLYLCRLIVNRLNGKIKTDPSYTKGSRFVITMPIATPSKPSEPTD